MLYIEKKIKTFPQTHLPTYPPLNLCLTCASSATLCWFAGNTQQAYFQQEQLQPRISLWQMDLQLKNRCPGLLCNFQIQDCVAVSMQTVIQCQAGIITCCISDGLLVSCDFTVTFWSCNLAVQIESLDLMSVISQIRLAKIQSTKIVSSPNHHSPIRVLWCRKKWKIRVMWQQEATAPTEISIDANISQLMKNK